MRRYFALRNSAFNATVRQAQADFKEQRGYDRDAKKADMKPSDRTALNKLSARLRDGYQMTAEEQAELDIAKTLPNETYLTAANLAKLAEEHPVIYDAYTATIRAATRSKSLEADIPYYYGDSARAVSDDFIASVNRENGMRFSSWSDFQIQHMLDMMTAVIELSTRHCAMHGYTKFLEQVRIFGKTGMMFNMSGVPNGTGLKADGSLDFSATESVLVHGQNGEYDAIQAREDFPETAGLQCIGISADHIQALLDSDIIDYIIPYHTSGLNATLRRMAQISNWDDFTTFQNAKVDSSIKFDPSIHDRSTWHKEPVFSEFFSAAKQKSNGYRAGEKGVVTMRRAAELYKQMCRERGMMPKFSWGSAKVDADFSSDPNYWKLLIDRKMINQKTGALIEQKPVRPNFDFDLIERMVQAEVDAYDPTLQDRALDYVRAHMDELPQRIADLKKAGAVKKATTSKKMSKAAKTLQAGPVAAVGAGNSQQKAQFSLKPVAPVRPSSDAWKPTHTTEEAMEAYPNLWNVAAEESEKRNPTQIASTQGTYRKIYTILKNQGFTGTILDASSGLGLGTKVGREEFGFDVDDIEPYPDASYKPKYTDYSRLHKQYDAIISSAVLNVLPQDQRDALVVKMGELLRPGGKMYITTRGTDVESLAKTGKNIHLGNMEWIETVKGSYQKGFTQSELKAYLEDALGPDFTVELSSAKNGGKFNNNTSIVVTKKAATTGDVEQLSRRDASRRDEDLLKRAYQKMLRDKQRVIDQYGKQAEADLETYQRQAEDYQTKEKEVYDGLQELDRLVQAGSDPDAIKAQRDKVTAAEARMTTALKRLSKLEERPALQQILQRERAIEREKTRDRIRESTNRKELRGRIDRLWKDLNRRITSPTEKKHIPVSVMGQAVEVLQALNMDSSREGTKNGEKLRSKLTELRARYAELQNDPDYRQAAFYDPQVAEYLDSMIQAVGDTPINQMSVSQLEAVYRTLQALDHTARNALKLKIGEEERSAYEISKQMTRETRTAPRPKTVLGNAWVNAQMSPERMFHRLGGYLKDSAWDQVYRMLNDGQLRQTQLQMEGSLIFDELLADKQYGKFVDPRETVDIGLKDELGDPVPVTHGMMVSLWMHLQNEQNRRHVAYGGLTIPSLKDYYNGKKTRGSERATRVGGVLQELAEINDRLQETEDADEIAALEARRDELAIEAQDYLETLLENIEEHLTSYDRAWITACRELFDGFSKRVLNETTMQVYGIRRANVENYFPIWVDGDFLSTPFETVAKDMSLENAGFMKERVDSSKPIRLADVSEVASSQIRKVAQYAGLMPAVRDFGKIWGKTQTGYRDSLRKAVHETFGQSGMQYIENLMADLNGARGQDGGALGEFFNRVRGHMAQASLTLSLRVALGQTASYPTAAAVVGWKALHKAFWHGGRSNRMISRADQELIRKWSPLLYYRMKGYSSTELGDIAGMNDKFSRVWKKARWLTGWIQAMDGATVGRLWYAAEYYVQDHNKDLQKGTDAYYEEVARVFNDIVEKTQPNYTTMQRPDILRNPNALVKQLTMFLTQRLQNFNILYDALATYSVTKSNFKAGTNGVTREDVRQAAADTRRAVISQLAAAATITAFKFGADIVLHSLNAYRDDKDKELKAESVSMELLDMFIDSLAGNFLGGGEVYDVIESKVFGKTYYGIEVSGVATVMDLVGSASTVYDHVARAIRDKDYEYGRDKILKDLDDLARNFGPVAGIPYQNAKKIVNACRYWIQDMINGEKLWESSAGIDRTNMQQAHRLYTAYTEMNGAKVNKVLSEVPEDKQAALYADVRKLIKQSCENDEITVYEALRQMQKYGNASEQVMANYIKELYADGKLQKGDMEKYLVQYGGKTQESAAKIATNASAKQETGVNYNDIDDLYKTGNLSADDARKALVEYGIEQDTAEMKVAYWDYQMQNPGTSMTTEDRFETYWKRYKPIGMTPEVYDDYYVRWNAVQGTDNNGDGKADSGSKKAERLLIIDSLPLSDDQKDELFLMNWAAGGLKDAPWHK